MYARIDFFLVSFLSIDTFIHHGSLSLFLGGQLCSGPNFRFRFLQKNHSQTYTVCSMLPSLELDEPKRQGGTRRCFRQLFLWILHYFFMATTTFQSNFYKVSNSNHFRKVDCAVCVCTICVLYEYVCA